MAEIISGWQYVSKYEGDLVAKCYFAKHKIVWEILDGGLKSKIEIQWSDIKAMKANLCDDGPGTLTLTVMHYIYVMFICSMRWNCAIRVVIFSFILLQNIGLFLKLLSWTLFICCLLQLLRPPLFFKESDPQPRKHTVWQPIADFTDGQASIHR